MGGGHRIAAFPLSCTCSWFTSPGTPATVSPYLAHHIVSVPVSICILQTDSQEGSVHIMCGILGVIYQNIWRATQEPGEDRRLWEVESLRVRTLSVSCELVWRQNGTDFFLHGKRYLSLPGDVVFVKTSKFRLLNSPVFHSSFITHGQQSSCCPVSTLARC